jgi:hypothetical protein
VDSGTGDPRGYEGTNSSEAVSSEELAVEAASLVAAAQGQGVALRLTGSAAIRLRFPDQVLLLERLGRSPLRDLDFFAREKQSRRLTAVFEARGYSMDPAIRQSQEFGIKRHIYLAPGNRYKVDVFLDDLIMSHTLQLRERLDLPGLTVALSDLLLSKLQIHEITRNDLVDMMVLFAGSDALGKDTHDSDTARVLSVLRDDWGFWYTSTSNLRRLTEELAHDEPLLGGLAPELVQRAGTLLELLEEVPKSLRWKLRARVGTKTRWYEEVGEVDRDHG